jgi:uncharacterized protein (TIGR02246 family)
MTTAETNLATPEALMRCFTDRLNAGDLDGLVELYEPSAVFEPQPGVVVHGHTAIRHALSELLAIGPTIRAETVEVLAAEDLALVVNDWTMTAAAPDGTDVRQGGRSADVVRRQSDGRWLVAVDKP